MMLNAIMDPEGRTYISKLASSRVEFRIVDLRGYLRLLSSHTPLVCCYVA